MIRPLKITTATRFWQRLCGIKKVADIETALYFPRCKAVHTFGVKKALDLFWVSRSGLIIQQNFKVPANKIKACSKAYGVVEVFSQLNPKLKLGDKIKLPGQALVESALVLPVLFLLLFGFLELSLMLQSQQRLTHQAHLATQILSLTNNDEKLAGSLLSAYQEDEIQISITSLKSGSDLEITSAERRYSDLVQVSIGQPYTLNIPFFNRPNFDLTAQASARILCQNLTTPFQCD
ncbi:hypothetical protein GW756_01010 [bacterium]|nr:hypothetical protein [bacterium]NCQ54936.1 hypothetical protein [Candidatus Parcubacteria bacterium]NCS66980.1 hypothetical protein [Candidatus Peregrinibacteria bacterium]NCS95926.1 hypothetical protein [bacterium]